MISFQPSENRDDIAVINIRQVGLLEKQLHSLNANRKKQMRGLSDSGES